MTIDEAESILSTRWVKAFEDRIPGYYWHPSFDSDDAKTTYDASDLLETLRGAKCNRHKDDNRFLAKCMHFAADVATRAENEADERLAMRTYFECRNGLILGVQGLPSYVLKRWDYASVERWQLRSEIQVLAIEKCDKWNPWRRPEFFSFMALVVGRELTHFRRHQDDTFSRIASELSLGELPSVHDDDFAQRQVIAGLLPQIKYLVSLKQWIYLRNYFGLEGREPLGAREIAKIAGVCIQAVYLALGAAYKTIRNERPDLIEIIGGDVNMVPFE